MDWITDPNALVGLLTLTALEIVLGIDNIIFISILSGRLPEAQRGRARTMGLAAAMVTRILLLASLAWIAHLTRGLFTVAGHEVTARDLVLLGGGLFLLAAAWVSFLTVRYFSGSAAVAGHQVESATVALIVLGVLAVVFALAPVGMAKPEIKEAFKV